MSEREDIKALIARIEMDACPGFGDLATQCCKSLDALKAMLARDNREATAKKPAPHASLEVMGNIQIDEGGELQPYYKALVITFDTTDQIREAIAVGRCTFSFKE